MATALKNSSPSFEQLVHEHFTDSKVMAYCLLLFSLCMMVVLLSNRHETHAINFGNPDYVPGSKPSVVIPIPTGQQTKPDFRLRV